LACDCYEGALATADCFPCQTHEGAVAMTAGENPRRGSRNDSRGKPTKEGARNDKAKRSHYEIVFGALSGEVTCHYEVCFGAFTGEVIFNFQ